MGLAEHIVRPPSNSGISLKPTPKSYSLEQDKSQAPGATVAWVRERFAGMGSEILQKCMRIDTGRLGIPVYISLCGPEATLLTGTAKQMGKGASPDQAEASALMELAERFSFFRFMRQTDFPLLTPAQAGERAMDFAQAAKAVYHPAEDLERAQRVYELLPQSWAWARDLAQDRDELIPISWFYAINEYNGPAAGNCPEEAVLQSLCEVVERHVSALVTIERRPTPAIEPDSVDDAIAAELLAKYARGRDQGFHQGFHLRHGHPHSGRPVL